MIKLNEHYVCLGDVKKKEDLKEILSTWTPFVNNRYEDGPLLLRMVDWAQNNIDCHFAVVAGDLYFEDSQDFFKFALVFSEYKGIREDRDEEKEGPEAWSAKPIKP